MFIAGHAAAGALIGQQVGTNPILIFLLAFVSHFLMDIVPHGDGHHVHDYFIGGKKHLKKLYNVLLVDSIATIILFALMMAYFQLNRMAVAWGVIGGVLPDLLVGINEIWKESKIKWFSKLHFRFHNALIDKIKVKPWPGAIGQFIIIALLLYAI
jgi:hypothetical protein